MGKTKKAIVMTDEERVAFEEQQRLLEDEMRKTKENVLTQFLKDKLMHEERATQFNMNKLNHLWRQIMRDEKSAELKKDFELLSQTFERVIDAKDAFIRALGNDMLESEEMYSMAVRSHVQVTDNLLDLHNERLDMISREYCQQLEMICEEFDLERAMLKEHHHTEMNNIDDILYAMDAMHQADESEALAEYEMMEVEIKNKSLEGKQALRLKLGTKIEELWQQFRQMLHNCNEINEDRRTAFDIIKQKDDKRSKEIDINNRKLARLEKQIRQLRARLRARTRGYDKGEGSAKDDDEDEAFNRAERMRLAKDFHQTKEEINQVRLHASEKLVRLIIDSSKAVKELRKQIDKAVSVLKLAEICRKLETEEEKLVPFYVSSLGEQKNLKNVAVEPSSRLLAEAMQDCYGLENFWKRYNKVLLDKLSLDKEKDSLTAENQQLRRLLKQYMDSISVNEQVMNQNNPLLVVKNGLTSCKMPEMCTCLRQAPPKTVIEAAHVARQLLN